MTVWKKLPIRECGEPLVPLGPFSSYPEIGGNAIYFGERTDSPYFPKGLNGSLLTHFVRQGAAERLQSASKNLPAGVILWLWDCFRPLEVQKALSDGYLQKLTAGHPEWSEEERSGEAQRFVSLPSYDPLRPSPHNTGGSVDLTLAILPFPHSIEHLGLVMLIKQISAHDPEEKHWRALYILHMRLADIHRSFATLLPMGTLCDEVKPETAAYYFDDRQSKNPRERLPARNRRTLRKAMERAGFSQYREEWWHYNFGNQMWASESDHQTAIYGMANFTEENRWWENMRRAHFRRQVLWHNGGQVVLAESGKLGAHPLAKEALQFAKRWASTFSDPRNTSKPEPQAVIL